MRHTPLACVVLAAGRGTRMKSAYPKVLHRIAGRTMIGHVMATVQALDPDHTVVVIGPDMDAVAREVAPLPTAVQARQLGTADAVRAARESLAGFTGDVLVLYGDTPLVQSETLQALITARHHPSDPAVVVLGMRPNDPARYGRLVVSPRGELEKIIEYLDATPDERALTLCNAGLMVFDGMRLFDIIDRIGNDNAKGEYYLTDAVTIARASGYSSRMVEGSPTEVLGVNARVELAEIEHLMQTRLRRLAMDSGATLVDPSSVHLSHDTRLGRDVVVAPNVVFGPGVEVEDDVEIRSFCHLEHVRIGTGSTIGPFARLRPGADLAADVQVGNFVEIKNSRIESGSKINHLSYIGDAAIGAGTNIGAGTITCNYDGFAKHRTDIGSGVFVGSNTALVAPVTVGDQAIIGAGSVITNDVADNALAVGRARQRVLGGWAERFRDMKTGKRADST